MKIKEIVAFPVSFPQPAPDPRARRPAWSETAEVANPMSRYPRYKRIRRLWSPNWPPLACVVTAEDGTWGLGFTTHSGPVAPVINDHFARLLVDEECTATERLWDMMFRIASPYGSSGLASYAISAVDLALWDLKGKLLGRPVYELLGGPARDSIFCYATGNDTDWYMELGFEATKLACPYGPADGLDGLRKNEELVAKARETIGPAVELMLDCWMALDLEFAVRQAERLRQYDLKWLEDSLIPGRLPGVRGDASASAVADAGDGRALVHDGAVHGGRGPAFGRHLPAGHPVGRRRDGDREDMPHRGGRGDIGDPSRRHERRLRPACVLRDAGRPVGRAVGRRRRRACPLGATSTAGV